MSERKTRPDTRAIMRRMRERESRMQAKPAPQRYTEWTAEEDAALFDVYLMTGSFKAVQKVLRRQPATIIRRIDDICKRRILYRADDVATSRIQRDDYFWTKADRDIVLRCVGRDISVTEEDVTEWLAYTAKLLGRTAQAFSNAMIRLGLHHGQRPVDNDTDMVRLVLSRLKPHEARQAVDRLRCGLSLGTDATTKHVLETDLGVHVYRAIVRLRTLYINPSSINDVLTTKA